MHEYWHDYRKPKYEDTAKAFSTDMDCFKIHVKSKEAYVDLAGDISKRFDKSKYIIERPKEG